MGIGDLGGISKDVGPFKVKIIGGQPFVDMWDCIFGIGDQCTLIFFCEITFEVAKRSVMLDRCWGN